MAYQHIYGKPFSHHDTHCEPSANYSLNHDRGHLMTDDKVRTQPQNCVSQGHTLSHKNGSNTHLNNSLVFTPNGFHQELCVRFPDNSRSLVVCKACKRRGKTRYYCRIQKCHTALPWTDIYLCFIVDESCLQNKAENETSKFQNEASRCFLKDEYITTHVIRPEPFEMGTGSFEKKAMPVCSSCKERNYTRSYCRIKKEHRQLPWNAENIVLTCAGNHTYASRGPVKATSDTYRHYLSENKNDLQDTSTKEAQARTQVEFSVIDSSRVFLLKISHASSKLSWLDRNDEAVSSSIAQVMKMPSYNPYEYSYFERNQNRCYQMCLPTHENRNFYRPYPRTSFTPPARDSLPPPYDPQITSTQINQNSMSHSYSTQLQPSFTCGTNHFDWYHVNQEREKYAEYCRSRNEMNSFDWTLDDEENDERK